MGSATSTLSNPRPRTPPQGFTFGKRILHFVYDLVFLLFLVLTAPYFLIRSIREPGLRASIPGRFGRCPARSGSGPCVWVHGVSVGEVKTADSLVRKLNEVRPNVDVLISSTTPAGMNVAGKLYPDLTLLQFPLDLSFIIRRVLRRVRPSLIVLMELEVWPNLLLQATEKGIPVIVVNGRMTERSFRGYGRFRWLLPRFEWISMYSVQSEEYAGRLRELGVPEQQIRITGNLKYDNLRLSCDPTVLSRVREELSLDGSGKTLVAGSTHPGEEEVLLELLPEWERAVPGLRLLIAPRHVERAAEVRRTIERFGRKVVNLTELRAGKMRPPRDSVAVLDTIGELESFYGVADVVFVGGSMVPRGGHNILEPAGLGKPLVFGPHMENFREEVRLLRSADGGVQVADAAELGNVVARLLQDEEQAAELGGRARQAVNSVRGTTQRNLELILGHLT